MLQLGEKHSLKRGHQVQRSGWRNRLDISEKTQGRAGWGKNCILGNREYFLEALEKWQTQQEMVT